MFTEIRFSKLNGKLKGIYRKRVAKKRYGLTASPNFYQLHIGFRSLYIQRVKPQRAVSESWGDTWQNRMLSGLAQFRNLI